jgi:hypothetical protein
MSPGALPPRIRIEADLGGGDSPIERGEQLLQLVEHLAHRIDRAGPGGVERFLRRVDLAQGQQCLVLRVPSGLRRYGCSTAIPIIQSRSGFAGFIGGDAVHCLTFFSGSDGLWENQMNQIGRVLLEDAGLKEEEGGA